MSQNVGVSKCLKVSKRKRHMHLLHTGGGLWVIKTPTAWVKLFALQATRITTRCAPIKLHMDRIKYSMGHYTLQYSILNLTNHNVRHSIKTPYVIKDPLNKERPPTLPMKTLYVTKWCIILYNFFRQNLMFKVFWRFHTFNVFTFTFWNCSALWQFKLGNVDIMWRLRLVTVTYCTVTF